MRPNFLSGDQIFPAGSPRGSLFRRYCVRIINFVSRRVFPLTHMGKMANFLATRFSSLVATKNNLLSQLLLLHHEFVQGGVLVERLPV